MRINMVAVVTLGALVGVVVLLTFLCVIVPLLLTTRRAVLKGASPLFSYFGAIGFGFMLVEISQMQRLIVFLGHPVYGLSVVLFALLLSSGAGSLFTQRALAKRPSVLLGCLLVALASFGFLTPVAIRAFGAETTPVRIAIAIVTLLPIGFFMGMALPLGMKLVSRRSSGLAPWLWGINGATSVCASVVSVAIALSFGISAAFWAGLFCYAIAVLCYMWADAQKSVLEDSESGAGTLAVASKDEARSMAG
jgi:predicted membrane-bound spermidine synthase